LATPFEQASVIAAVFDLPVPIAVPVEIDVLKRLHH
jgi:hypothetical protein